MTFASDILITENRYSLFRQVRKGRPGMRLSQRPSPLCFLTGVIMNRGALLIIYMQNQGSGPEKGPQHDREQTRSSCLLRIVHDPVKDWIRNIQNLHSFNDVASSPLLQIPPDTIHGGYFCTRVLRDGSLEFLAYHATFS